LIEAGVDVDFPIVMRAEAGLDSIAQAHKCSGLINNIFNKIWRTPSLSTKLFV